MSWQFGPRVREISTTTGTGTISLGGVANADMLTFVSGVGAGAERAYLIEHSDRSLNEWELGVGTVTDGSPDTISRDTVLLSSAGGTTKVPFSAGDKHVSNVVPGIATKGHILVGTGSGMAAIPVGANGEVLVADSTQPGGVKWAVPNAADADTLDGQHASAFAALAGAAFTGNVRAPMLGVGTDPSASNPVFLKVDRVTLDAATAGIQGKFNKASAADTASFLFQTGWTSYAEFGTIGDNDFRLKVSDGTNWFSAWTITHTTGKADFAVTPSVGGTDVSLTTHTHSDATTSVAGFMASTDKSKLDGIEAGAQVNPADTDALSEGTTNLYHTAARASAAAPVQSVNGYTGTVSLGASDVNAASDTDARFGSGSNSDVNTSGTTIIDSITTDNYGHITGRSTRNLGNMSQHTQTVSTSSPSGGSNGDVHFLV